MLCQVKKPVLLAFSASGCWRSSSRASGRSLSARARAPAWFIRQQLYYSNYNFNLFSNFTFFLENEEDGDEINQTDARNIYGYTGTY